MISINKEDYQGVGPEHIVIDYLYDNPSPENGTGAMIDALEGCKTARDNTLEAVLGLLDKQHDEIDEIITFLRSRNSSNESIKQMSVLLWRTEEIAKMCADTLESAMYWQERASGL